MEQTFESILENWINGNRGDVRKMVNKLSSNEQYQFKNWLREKHSDGSYYSGDIFEMVLFICFE